MARPDRVYLGLRAGAAFSSWLVFTMNLLYQASVVGLDPLQLVLVGTCLEATVFVFEVPTGLVADVVSRKLSIVAGHLLIGCGFLLQGLVPAFGAILASQVVSGLGYTFTSGATQAWLADEVGAQRASKLFARGAQVAHIGALAGIGASTALGAFSIPLPIVCGGLAMMGLAGGLVLFLRESRRERTPEATTFAGFLELLRKAAALARASRTIRSLLLLALCYGLASEGLDRLWIPRLLNGFDEIGASPWKPALWFGAAAAGFHVLAIASTSVSARVAARGSVRAAAAFLLAAFLTIVALAAFFALTSSFYAAFAAFALIAATHAAIDPLQEGLMNAAIPDSSVRATLFSAAGQADAIGQIAGGPVAGVAGRFWSVRAGLLASALLLTPGPAALAALLRRRSGPAPTGDEV